jgi:hypothetical protein
MKRLISFIVCISLILALSWWINRNTIEHDTETNQPKSSKVQAKFIIVDSIEDAHSVEKTQSMPNSDKPQNIPNANPDSPIIIAKLPQTKKASSNILSSQSSKSNSGETLSNSSN